MQMGVTTAYYTTCTSDLQVMTDAAVMIGALIRAFPCMKEPAPLVRYIFDVIWFIEGSSGPPIWMMHVGDALWAAKLQRLMWCDGCRPLQLMTPQSRYTVPGRVQMRCIFCPGEFSQAFCNFCKVTGRMDSPMSAEGTPYAYGSEGPSPVQVFADRMRAAGQHNCVEL